LDASRLHFFGLSSAAVIMGFLGKSFLFFGLVFLLVASLVQGGLFDKKKDDDEKYTGKDNAELGFKGLADSRKWPAQIDLCAQ
jgi:hypothetical protein